MEDRRTLLGPGSGSHFPSDVLRVCGDRDGGLGFGPFAGQSQAGDTCPWPRPSGKVRVQARHNQRCFFNAKPEPGASLRCIAGVCLPWTSCSSSSSPWGVGPCWRKGWWQIPARVPVPPAGSGESCKMRIHALAPAATASSGCDETRLPPLTRCG